MPLVQRATVEVLNAGVLEDGTRTRSVQGTPQGGTASPAVSRGRGSGTVAVDDNGAGGPHAGSPMDRVGATDSYGGGEGDGVRGVAYSAISRSG